MLQLYCRYHNDLKLYIGRRLTVLNFKRILIKTAVTFSVAAMLPFQAFATSGKVTADVLNVRTQPSTSSAIVGVLYNGAAVNIIEDAGNGWLKIQHGQQSAYVSAQYVNVEEVVKTGTVTASLLNVRQAPSLSGAVVAQAPNGTVLNILDTSDSYWYKVRYGAVEGYAASEYINTSERRVYDTTSRSGIVDRTAASDNAALIDFAKSFLGIPYVYGGSTPAGFDCSGFVMYVFSQFGVSLSRTTYTQVNEGTYVPKDQLRMGDLVFFAPGGNVNHVGIYISDGNFIHSTHTGDVVKISNLNSPGYYSNNYYTARRVR